MKKLVCVALLLLLAGCLPIGIRGQNLYTGTPTSSPHAG
jgi:hypothetical protein